MHPKEADDPAPEYTCIPPEHNLWEEDEAYCGKDNCNLRENTLVQAREQSREESDAT
jgi:hypothetical protein